MAKRVSLEIQTTILQSYLSANESREKIIIAHDFGCDERYSFFFSTRENLLNRITTVETNPDWRGKPTAKRSIGEDLERKAGY